MYDISPVQHLSKTFTCSSKVTLLNIRKALVKVTFATPLQYLSGVIFLSSKCYHSPHSRRQPAYTGSLPSGSSSVRLFWNTEFNIQHYTTYTGWEKRAIQFREAGVLDDGIIILYYLLQHSYPGVKATWAEYITLHVASSSSLQLPSRVCWSGLLLWPFHT